MKQWFIYTCACLITALGASIGVQAAETLKLGHVYPTERYDHTCAVQIADQIGKRTDGRFEIAVFPNSALGNEEEMHEGLSFGTVNMVFGGTTFLAATYPPLGLEPSPFAFRNYEHWKAYSRSDLRRELERGYEETTGNKILGTHYQGFRYVLADKEINSPADMKDVKIRVPNAPAYLVFPRAVGANPTPIAYAETYLALQQGVVDMVENPVAGIKAMKFYEQRKVINLTRHMLSVVNTVVSGPLWKRLSDTDKKIFTDVATEVSENCSDEIHRLESVLLDEFRKSGIKVNEVDDFAAFEKAVEPYVTDPSKTAWTKAQYLSLKAIK